MRIFVESVFTFVAGSHAEEADWLRVQVRSGEAALVSTFSSFFSTSEERGESGDFGSLLSSSLSTSRATRLGLEKKKSGYTQRHTETHNYGG